MKKEADAAKVREEKEEAEKKAAAAADAWNNEQQKQMEVGMKEFGANIPTKERWISIASKVDGKNAKQCYGRFKDLCAKAKQAK